MAVVRGEVFDAKRDALTAAEYEVHRYWRDALETMEMIAVVGELEDVMSLYGACELRIDDLVTPRRAEARGGKLDAFEEIRVAVPEAVEEGRLVNVVRATLHGRDGLLFSSAQCVDAPRRLFDGDDTLAGGAQRLDVGVFAFVAFFAEQCSHRGRRPRGKRRHRAGLYGSVEPGGVIAANELRQIAGGKNEVRAGWTHRTIDTR